MDAETADYLELTIQDTSGYDNVKTGRENGITTQSHAETSLGKSRNPGKKESNVTTKHIDKATTEDQSVTNLNEESVYHRIHKYDSDGGFELSKAYLDRTRPLPSIPTIREGTREDASLPRKLRSRHGLAIIIIVLILVVCGALVGLTKITCFQNWSCDSNDSDSPPPPPPDSTTLSSSTSMMSTTGQPLEQACDIAIPTNYSEPVNASCTVTILNAQTVSFQSGNVEEASNSFQGDTLNITVRGITVHMVRTIEDVKVMVNIPEVNCSTAGLHQVRFSNGTGTRTFDIHITIIHYPDTPTIGARYDVLGGLVEGLTGQIICQARVGCGPVPTMFRKVFDEYQPIVSYNVSSNETNDLGRAYNVTLTINNIHMVSVNGSQYMCSYVDDGVTYQSEDFMALVVPGDYCLNRGNCHKHHPYVCNKYIACSHGRPTEMRCALSDQHFYLPDGECAGQCESKSVANCPIGK